MPANQVVIADANAVAFWEQHPVPVVTTRADSSESDAFGRLRVSNPNTQFDSQLTYNLNPLLFEQITAQTGAAIAHDATERAALLTFANTPNGGKAYMQGYEHIRYQPGNGQLIFATFNFREHKANVTKFVGYGDVDSNAIQFISNGTGFAWRILSNTTAGDETVLQANWNLDPLNGSGISGITLNVAYTQIIVIDLQALYTGRVRVGFDINGQIIYCHEFLHANLVAYPYIQSASLPVICGMTCTGTVSTTMLFICCTVKSDGGETDLPGYGFSAGGTATAGSDTRTHILSVRPKTTFNSIANRIKFILETIEVIVTGNTPVLWELCVGQAISGTTTFNDVNTTYSAFEYNTAGTISGSPAIVIASGFNAASATTRTVTTAKISNRYPITLDAAGAVRALGTLSLIVTGLGATSATRAVFNWKELR